MRYLACAIVLAGCFEHHGMDQAVDNSACALCHMPEYNATGTAQFPTSPAHATAMPVCDTNCANCHTTQQWQNGLVACGHPEDNFPLMSQGTQHTNIKCIECHSIAINAATGATSAGGADTDCISCHPNTTQQQNDHIGVTYDSGTLVGQPYAYSTTDHRFCLDCHPKGLAIGHSAGNPFILPHPKSGAAATCAQCHDNASGLGHQNGDDVTCVNSQCHTNVPTHHEGGNPGTGVHVGTTTPSCIAAHCHPDGRSN